MPDHNTGAGAPAGGCLVGCDDDRVVLAARLQNVKDHQFGLRKQPLFGFRAGCFRGANNPAEVLVPRNPAEMVQANAGQNTDLIFGEDFLAELDSHHV